MPNEPSKDTSLSPLSDGDREDSGLQDILAVAAKIKDKPAKADDDDPGDSGVIMFTAGSGDVEAGGLDDDDDALFGSFAGGLDLAAPNSLAAEVSMAEASAAGASVAAAQPAAGAGSADKDEGGNKGLIIVAAVLGLGLLGLGAKFMMDGDKPADQDQQARVEPAVDSGAAVGQVEEPALDPEADAAGGASGAAVEPEPAPVDEIIDEPIEGDTDGLGAMGEDAGDPMGTREDLLDKKDSGVAKAGKWDQGTSKKPANKDPVEAPPPEPDPDPDPVMDPLPDPGGNEKVTEEDVDCLLNPDLAKCNNTAGPKPKQHEILAPKIPDKLSSTQLRSGFSSVKPLAKKCGGQHGAAAGTKVKIHVSIEGASGKVTSAKATGEHAGTPLGTCVENAAKNAQFEQFKKPAMGIDYPLIM